MLKSINTESSVAVYVQIQNQIQFAIASGSLKEGDQLPPIREWVDQLGINPNTVMKAYRELEVMGFLRARRGMGFYVQKGAAGEVRERCRKRIAERLYEAVSEARAAGMGIAQARKIVDSSYESAGGPYETVPKEVVKLAAKAGRK